MNHFSHDVKQATDAEATASAPVNPSPSTPPVKVETTRELIEASLRRLNEETNVDATAPTSNFDALDYAKLASAPRNAGFGENDPYVNPADQEEPDAALAPESPDQAAPDDIPPAKTIDEILQKLSGYQSEIDVVEKTEEGHGETEEGHGETASSNSDPDPLTTDTTGDTILIDPTVEFSVKPENIESLEAGNDFLTHSIQDLADDPIVDETPPVAWFADPVTATPDNAALNESDSACDTAPTMPLPLPLVSAANEDDPDSSEAVFDVRDFEDSADGVVEPIAGSQEVDPDFFEFNTLKEVNPESDENQVFIAGHGDVIQIDGNDGFSHIDLACFEVHQATFEKQVIKIDSGDGDVFEVHHQNIPYALFAEGVEVDLTPEESHDESN